MPKVGLPNIEFRSPSLVVLQDSGGFPYTFPFSTVLFICDSLHHERSVLVSDRDLVRFLEVYGIATEIGSPGAIKAKMVPDYNFKLFYKVINKEFVKTINELTGAL